MQNHLEKWAREQLQNHPAASELDIRWALEFCKKKYPSSAKDQEQHFKQLILRRAQGEPLAYLIEEKGFYGHIFLTHPQVLIPRPESEHLVQAALKWAKTQKPKPVFLDVGCGSGCLGISISKELKSPVFSIDISEAAVKLTEKNITTLKAPLVQVQKIRAQDLSPKQLPFPIDAVVMNPPYIGNKDPIDPAVKKYEPHEALFGGGDLGLDVFQSWLKPLLSLQAKAWFIETSPFQYKALWEILKVHFSHIEVHKDYAGNQRVLQALGAN